MGEALRTRATWTALLVAGFFAFMALAVTPGAKAATVGDPVEVDFNYIGLNADVSIEKVNQLVFTPGSFDPPQVLELRGEFTSESGAFSLDKETGLVFPDLPLDDLLAGVDLFAAIGLAEDATGTYNEATGEMTLNPILFLTLGVGDVATIPAEFKPLIGIPSNATGPLRCTFSPLDVSLSTGGRWPADGDVFGPGLTEGSLSGAFTSIPPVSTEAGPSAACGTIGAFLIAPGGIWLGSTSATLTAMPTASGNAPCVGGLVFNGTSCVKPACPSGQVGTPPNCKTPSTPKGAILGAPSFAKTKATAKRGKSVTLVVRVRNTGDRSSTATVSLSSNNKQVKVPKSVKVTAGPGQTGTAKVKVTTTKKAKGKATITAKVAGKSGKAVITVRK